MTRYSDLVFSGGRACAAVALLLAVGCSGNEVVSPTAETPLASAPADSIGAIPPDSSTGGTGDSIPVPIDSTALPPVDSSGVDSATMEPVITATGTQLGIPHGAFNTRAANMTPLLNGTMQGIAPEYLMSDLAMIRAKGGRMILKMHGGPDHLVQNGDGTFSFTKWKALADRYRKYDFRSYVADGTLMGHYLIDEPQNPKKWGGKAIPHSMVEAMAKYSKQVWPTLPTIARARPTWLAQATFSYVYLDAGWFQYEYRMGDLAALLAADVAAAKRKGLGLVSGMNVLDGGNGSSGRRGWTSSKYMMSATEIRNYGTTILKQSYVCGFLSWTYSYQGADYFGTTAVKSALTDLATLAKGHLRTSCRQ